MTSSKARTVSDPEFEAVTRLAAPARYEHTIKQIADTEEAWLVADKNGIVIVADDAGREAMPLWPNPRYAEAWPELGDARTESIALDELLDRALPELARDGRYVAVFPTPTGAGTLVEADRLRRDLEAYIEEWY